MEGSHHLVCYFFPSTTSQQDTCRGRGRKARRLVEKGKRADCGGVHAEDEASNCKSDGHFGLRLGITIIILASIRVSKINYSSSLQIHHPQVISYSL
jgi:hypothetical protein